ncbi:hypothetical protein TYRP_018617 [Tyrophagus putrescentiae]|nr:hypothetical protein TYRP_018617 [Tyrophagus putrescentiae]
MVAGKRYLMQSASVKLYLAATSYTDGAPRTSSKSVKSKSDCPPMYRSSHLLGMYFSSSSTELQKVKVLTVLPRKNLRDEILQKVRIEVDQSEAGDVPDDDEALAATLSVNVVDYAGDKLLKKEHQLVDLPVDLDAQVDDRPALVVVAVGKDGRRLGELIRPKDLRHLKALTICFSAFVLIAAVPLDEAKRPPLIDVFWVEEGRLLGDLLQKLRPHSGHLFFDALVKFPHMAIMFGNKVAKQLGCFRALRSQLCFDYRLITQCMYKSYKFEGKTLA